MSEICNHGKETSRDGGVCLICSLDEKNCCLIRWCVATQSIKMSNNYHKYGCKKVGVINGKEKEDC